MDKLSTIAAQLAEEGWALTEEFLPATELVALAQEARQLWQQGDFKAAGIGRGSGFRIRPEIRGDSILWLEQDRLTPAQMKYWSEIEKLRQRLNQELFLGLREFEAHYAVYPPGACYRKHLDRFSTSDERAISCSLYLNFGWERQDRGQLRLYLRQDDPDAVVEISPQAGTFVIFRSDTIYHEVLPTSKERFSLTGWFKRRSLSGDFWQVSRMS
jgi:SM-20-related protein